MYETNFVPSKDNLMDLATSMAQQEGLSRLLAEGRSPYFLANGIVTTDKPNTVHSFVPDGKGGVLMDIDSTRETVGRFGIVTSTIKQGNEIVGTSRAAVAVDPVTGDGIISFDEFGKDGQLERHRDATVQSSDKKIFIQDKDADGTRNDWQGRIDSLHSTFAIKYGFKGTSCSSSHVIHVDEMSKGGKAGLSIENHNTTCEKK